MPSPVFDQLAPNKPADKPRTIQPRTYLLTFAAALKEYDQWYAEHVMGLLRGYGILTVLPCGLTSIVLKGGKTCVHL